MNPKRTIAPDGSAVVDTAAIVREQWAFFRSERGATARLERMMDSKDLIHRLRQEDGSSYAAGLMQQAADLIEQQAAEIERLRAEIAKSILAFDTETGDDADVVRIEMLHICAAIATGHAPSKPTARNRNDSGTIERLRNQVDYMEQTAATLRDETLKAEREARRLRADRDAAVAEVGRIGRELGKSQAEADRLRVALYEIAGTTNLTATQTQFSRYLQRLALRALPDKRPPTPIGWSDTDWIAAIDAARGE